MHESPLAGIHAPLCLAAVLQAAAGTCHTQIGVYWSAKKADSRYFTPDRPSSHVLIAFFAMYLIAIDNKPGPQLRAAGRLACPIPWACAVSVQRLPDFFRPARQHGMVFAPVVLGLFLTAAPISVGVVLHFPQQADHALVIRLLQKPVVPIQFVLVECHGHSPLKMF